MSLVIGDNFNLQGKKPNFARDSFKTLAEMKRYPDTSIDEGHVSICLETGKRYEWRSTNSVDQVTGRWRLTVDTAIDDTSENPVQNKVISQTLKDNQEEIKESIRKSLQEFLERIESNEEVTVKNIEELKDDFEVVNKIVAGALSELARTKLDKDFELNGYKLTEGNLNLTKSDVGLDNVDNTSDEDKPISRAVEAAKADKYWFRDTSEMTEEEIASLSSLPSEIVKLRNLETQEQLVTRIQNSNDRLDEHVSNYNNPHKVTKSSVGLGNYNEDPRKLPIPNYLSQVRINGHSIFTEGQNTFTEINLIKSDVGLDNVDNTRDEDKPLSAVARLMADVIDKVVSTALNEIVEAIDTDRQTIAASLNNLNIRLQNIEREK